MRKSLVAIIVVCLLAVLVFFVLYEISINSRPQLKLISFTPKDYFTIPEYNGTINFAESGTYFSANLERPDGSIYFGSPVNYWKFEMLSLNKLPSAGDDLQFSVQNCNVTITNYYNNDEGNYWGNRQ